jgi:hypothetical protein
MSNQISNQSMTQARGQVLLEEWPQSSPTQRPKQVAFATYSQLKVYHLDPQYERKKCYSSSERKSFQAQAFNDASHIKCLINTCPYDGGHAMRYLIEKNLVLPEELIGIDSLIIGPQKVKDERRRHAKFVVKAQETLRESKDVNMDVKLAYVATARSMKAFEKARMCAALAA